MPPPPLTLTDAHADTRTAVVMTPIQALRDDFRNGYDWLSFIVFSLSGQNDLKNVCIHHLFISLSANRRVCSVSITIIRAIGAINR